MGRIDNILDSWVDELSSITETAVLLDQIRTEVCKEGAPHCEAVYVVCVFNAFLTARNRVGECKSYP
jgi:hypothetical protein